MVDRPIDVVHGAPIITTITEVSIHAVVEDEDVMSQRDLDDGHPLRRVFTFPLPCELEIESNKPVLVLLEPLLILLKRVLDSPRLVGVHHLEIGGTIGSDVVDLCGLQPIIRDSIRIHG